MSSTFGGSRPSSRLPTSERRQTTHQTYVPQSHAAHGCNHRRAAGLAGSTDSRSQAHTYPYTRRRCRSRRRRRPSPSTAAVSTARGRSLASSGPPELCATQPITRAPPVACQHLDPRPLAQIAPADNMNDGYFAIRSKSGEKQMSYTPVKERHGFVLGRGIPSWAPRL